ncbi:MAG: YjbQ family protein [Desulfovibrio sp.]|nr:YjbQ family protein [Desulfovibrio sp.]
MDILTIRTGSREEMISITRLLQELVSDHGLDEGVLVVHCPHTSACLTVNENADESVVADMLAALRTLVPRSGPYRHAEGNSDAHIKTSLVGPCLSLIVSGGKLQLGTWQGVFFCEFDGPRSRKIWAQWLGATKAP